MATQNPISTISYNSESFLLEKLETWRKAHIIQAYQYICHKGEDGDKDHIHLRIEPNKRLDPMVLQEELHEFPHGCVKPLGCRTFRPSKEEDWILYAVHDSTYLSMKYGGGERGEKIPYDWQDIRVPDDYDMQIAFIRAQASMKHSQGQIATRLQNGENPVSLILEGENVFLLNSISNALAGSDYKRLAAENNRLRSDLNNLLLAIQNYGLQVLTDDSGVVYLSPL